jgi:DNA polymerase III gamma/tau subunit
MLSLLLVGNNDSLRKQKIQDICKKNYIHIVDQTEFLFSNKIGIDDIRTIQKKVFLKPLKSTTKAIIIQHIDCATIEAQTALLKVLEEPPDNTQCILTASRIHTILPTITSRCKIIFIKEDKQTIVNDEEKIYTEYLRIIHLPIGEKLKIAQDITKDKEKTVSWLIDMITAIRAVMIKNCEREQSIQYVFFLQALQKTYIAVVNSNINIRFLIEDSLLTNFKTI